MQSSSVATQTTTTQTVSTPPQQQEISVDSVSSTIDEKKEGSVADNCKGDESEVDPIASETSNGVVAPNQAFANAPVGHQGMTALEDQFQSMGMNEVSVAVHHDKDGHNGEHDDDPPMKLFVGQVRCLALVLRFDVICSFVFLKF